MEEDKKLLQADQKLEEVADGMLPVVPLSCGGAIKDVLNTAGYSALSRAAVSVNVIANAVVVARLTVAENASGSFITTFTYAIMGSVRSIMNSTGILVGEQYGKKEYLQIGDTVRKSWILSALLSIPACTLLLCSGLILSGFGIDKDVATATQKYFIGLSYGIPAQFWLACDQQFALGIKRSKIILVSGVGYAVITMGVGFPLALMTKLGTAGLGHGAAISAWVSLIALRVYFRVKQKDFGQYQLFKFECKSLKFRGFLELISNGSALGFQNLAEWGNLLALSIMTGLISKEDLLALQVSLQPISAYTVMLMGFAQGVGVMVAQRRGASLLAFDSHDIKRAEVEKKNARIIGNTGIILGFFSSVGIGGLFIGLSNKLPSVFLEQQNASLANSTLASTLLIINSAGLSTDSIRNVAGSILVGNKDPWIPQFISFAAMSVLAAPIGGVVSLYLKLGSNWLFITRDIGITLAAVVTVYRWLRKSSPELEAVPLLAKYEGSTSNDLAEAVNSEIERVEEEVEEKQDKKSCWARFFRSKKRQAYTEITDSAEQKNCCVIL